MTHPIAHIDDGRGCEPGDHDARTSDVAAAAPRVAASAPSKPLRSAPEPTHYLVREETEGLWRIRPAELADFINLADYDYEIVENFINAPTSLIPIKHHDRIEIRNDGSSIELMHFSDGLTVGRGRNFTMVNDLWAIGDATVPPSNTVVGKYVLYLLENSVMTRHANSIRLDQSGECARVHFEYFETTDTEAQSHLPQVDVNIFDITTFDPSGKRETGEGDGDEGRRR